jgi:hypothetical protein
MLKRGRKAQFYIVAAIIIILIIVGMLATNYITPKPDDSSLYDISDVLKSESSRVIDYGIYKKEDMSQLIENWATQIKDYSNTLLAENQSLIFLYGDQENMTVLVFVETPSTISADIGGTTLVITISQTVLQPQYFKPTGNKINITIETDGKKVPYEFELKQGQNFYFVIKTDDKSIIR